MVMGNDTKQFWLMWVLVAAVLGIVVGWDFIIPQVYPSQPRPGIAQH